MRITNRMIGNNYMANLNSSLEDLTKLNEKVSSGRSYLKASEDPATALKAFQVRQNLSRISMYQDNISEAGDILTDVESAYSELNSILTDVSEQIIQGESDTSSEEDRSIIAQVLRNYQDEVFDIANAKSSDKYIFGGSEMNEAPFTLESDILYYHGTDVDSNTGIEEDDGVYYDIGMGLKTDGAGKVLESTALNISNPGSEVFGTGTDADGITNNIYNLLGEIAQQFEDNDLTNLDKYVSKLETISDDVLINYANVGQKTNFVEFLSNRLTTNEYNAETKQSSLEGIDEAEGIVDYNTQEAAYQAALAMGSKILQSSLLDYMM